MRIEAAQFGEEKSLLEGVSPQKESAFLGQGIEQDADFENLEQRELLKSFEGRASQFQSTFAQFDRNLDAKATAWDWRWPMRIVILVVLGFALFYAITTLGLAAALGALLEIPLNLFNGNNLGPLSAILFAVGVVFTFLFGIVFPIMRMGGLNDPSSRR